MEHHPRDGMVRHEHEAQADAGRPGDPDRVGRTVEVTMNDTLRFDPAEMKFKAGETVRFVVRNAGRIRHEMVIGSEAELAEHAAMMRANPAMQHADPNMIWLAPGQQDELVWQFGRSGAFAFACLVPGHLEAGMTGRIEVRGGPHTGYLHEVTIDRRVAICVSGMAAVGILALAWRGLS